MITVYGKPQGKGRPRYTVRGGHAVAYTPEGTRKYEHRHSLLPGPLSGKESGKGSNALRAGPGHR